MVQKLIGAKASDIRKMTKDELFTSIQESDGRVVLSESTAAKPSVIENITGAELSKAFGADMILLNDFDVNYPEVAAAYEEKSNLKKTELSRNVINHLKDLIGIPIGMSIEAIVENSLIKEEITYISTGKKASVETFLEAQKIGLDFIVLTGNPESGVTNNAIEKSISIAKDHFDGIIIAGKMHRSGVNEPIVNLKVAKKFIDAGADIILVPAVGSYYGIREESIREIVEYVHSKGKLVMSAIGTSQESSQPDVIRNIAIRNKILGVDIQHIGDSNMGLVGIENIKELSEAIRGKTYTIARMARSINR